MERSLIIRLGIAGSILAHLLVMAVIFLSTDVHPYEQAAPEPVAVDIVDSDEPAKAPEPLPNPSPTPDLVLPQKSATATTLAAATPAAAPAQQPPQQPPAKREAAAQPQQQQQSQPQQPSPTLASTPTTSQGYIPAQPDLTVKYGVMLGLPGPLPPPEPLGDKSEEGKGAGATATSNLATNLVAVFREHLRSCSKLPGSLSRSDNVMVKLRVIMTPDGRLAAEPDLIEVKSPIKGVDLKQAAVSALMACQPYAMLPPDRYAEWKVLELSFTPTDFGG